VAAVGLLVGAAVAGTGAVAADEVYGAPTPDDRLATYGQPADDLEPVYRAVDDRTGAGTDVLLFGDDFFLRPEGRADTPPVPDRFSGRLPLAWYLERADADVTSATRSEALADPPPVVVARASDRGTVSARLDGYEAETYRTALWNRRTVVFVRSATGTPSPRSVPGSGSGS
jgi:predicted membrane-bound mannosyltransferase